ncbi:MAG: trypsin-like peptidase domain-containing protein [Planctomycetota bacterium]
MRPHSFLTRLALAGTLSSLVPAAPGQSAGAAGVTNPSILVAPSAAAPATWASQTYEQTQASVVWVAVEVDGPRGQFELTRASSGVIVDGSGLVLTLLHLVREAIGADDKKVAVQLNDAANSRLEAKVVATDASRNLALLQVAPPADGLQAAKLGPAMPSFGEPLLVVARPTGEDMLAFAGVASAALAPVVLGGSKRTPDEFFLTDARSDERCDGAPVFGADGVLLGLYASEHVLLDVREPTLADLKRPSFGSVVSIELARDAFAAAFKTGSNPSLRAASQRDVHPWAKAVAAAQASVVGVRRVGANSAADPSDPGMAVRRASVGSGVVLSATGLVVANGHVCDGGNVEVVVGANTYPAEVVSTHARSNLALLEVELPAGVRLVPAGCGADDDAMLGEAVLALGRPSGQSVVVSKGVVSAKRGRRGLRIQADADLGNANGGGAIIDAAGRLIGIGDAGRIDPVEMAWMMRRDQAQQQTNLSTFVSIAQVRSAFASELGDCDAADAPILAAASAPAAAAGATRTSALTRMVEQVNGALLNVYISKNMAKVDPEDPFPPDPEWQTLGLGSGVIIDPSGLAISNWHVVDEATGPDGSSLDDHRLTVRVFSGREFEVEVLSISREDDLSLLQLKLEPGEQVPFVKLGSSDRLRIGESVAAIGNPHGRANTITYGVVSAKGDAIRVKGRWAKLKHLIETDAAINGGNSGGALLDMAGRLVGINSAGGGTFNNTGYAIAVDHVRRQLTGLLLQPYKLRSPNFGMRVLDDVDAKAVVVMDVDARGPAARAGIQSGDRIQSLAGVPIAWTPDYARRLSSLEAGVATTLVLLRGGEEVRVEVAPCAPEVWAAIRQSGLELEDFRYSADPDRVRQASIALYRAVTGDVNGEPVQIPVQVVAVGRAFRDGDRPQPLKPGDLLLGVELPGGIAGEPKLTPIDSVAMLRDLFNDQVVGKTKGVDHYKVPAEYEIWRERGGEVVKVTVPARRLLW